jgi:hypothetical protein
VQQAEEILRLLRDVAWALGLQLIELATADEGEARRPIGERAVEIEDDAGRAHAGQRAACVRR